MKLNISEKGGAHKMPVSRRDFLKLSGLGLAGLFANKQISPFLNDSPDTDYFIPNTGEMPSSPEKDFLTSIATKFKKLGGFFSIYADENGSTSLKEYVQKESNLNHRDLKSLEGRDEQEVALSDIGNIIEAITQSPGVEHERIAKIFDDPAYSDYQGLLRYFKLNNHVGDWKEVVTGYKLGKKILELGSRGKNTLSHLGLDLNDFSLQKDLVKPLIDPGYIDQGRNFILIKPNSDPHEDLLVTNSGDSRFFQYTQALSSDQLKPSIYVLNKIRNLLEDSNPDSLFAKNTQEYIYFQEWVYDAYYKEQLNNPKITEEIFQNNLLNKLSNESNQSSTGVQKKLDTIYQSFIRQGVSESDASAKVRTILNCNPKQFEEIIRTLTPGERSIFHDKSGRIIEPRTYQMILKESIADGKLDSELLTQALVKYSGNLYLQPIVDRVAAEGDQVAIAKSQDSMKSTSVIKELLSNNLTLEDYASSFFGQRRKIVTNDEGKVEGVILVGRVTEPVYEIPENMAKLLVGTEGKRWEKGTDYLATIFKRNSSSLVSKVLPFLNEVTASGGSDPAMQLMEIIFPGPFDQVTSLSDTNSGDYVFRRTDLYGASYLQKLYDAIRDDQYFGEIYESSESLVKLDDPSSTIVNRLCSKFESYILARDFSNKYGSDTLQKLYAQYVPLGVATGAASGIQIHGFEAAANYYFGKSLRASNEMGMEQINDAESSVLVGLVQAPIEYAPLKFDGESIIDNSRVTKDRAKTVANLGGKHGDINEFLLSTAIENVTFTCQAPIEWTTSFSINQINEMDEGVFKIPGIDLGLGIRVNQKNVVPSLPETVELPPHPSTEQITIKNWFSEVINDEQLRLSTKESSAVADIMRQFASSIQDTNGHYDEMIIRLQQLANSTYQDGFEYNYWEGVFMGEKGSFTDIPNPYDIKDPRSSLWTHLYELHSTPPGKFQCGQLSLLSNDFMRLSLNLKAPTVLAAGNVRNWANVLGGGNRGIPDKDYFSEGDYEVIRLDEKVLNPQDGEDTTQLFEVGDMVVSWHNAWGHVLTVMDKGVDSQGQSYVNIIDANFRNTGQIRQQTIWNEKLKNYIYPGKQNHVVVIRAKNLDHGNQIPLTEQDTNVLDRIILGTVDNGQIILPGYEQEVMTAEGKTELITNPGIAFNSYDSQGFRAGIDPTNILGTLPTPPGSGIMPFVHAFLVQEGVDPGKQVSILPGEVTLDDSKQWVANAAALGFNLQGVEGTASLDEALAAGIEIPFQTTMRDMIKADPKTWDRFQDFLTFFGIPLLNWNGEKHAKPTALGAIGRDSVVANLDRLGFALTVLCNPESFIDSDIHGEHLISTLRKTSGILLDSSIRKKIIIGDNNPIEEEVGHDLRSPAISNAVTDVEIAGNSAVWVGTNLGDSALGIILEKSDLNGKQNCNVTIGVAKGVLLKQANLNLSTQNYRANTIGSPGLPVLIAKAALKLKTL